MDSVKATTLTAKLVEGAHVHRNLSTPQLVEAAIARGEASLADNGALVALTGARTGRSRETSSSWGAHRQRYSGSGQSEPALRSGKIRIVAGESGRSHAGARPLRSRFVAGADKHYRLPCKSLPNTPGMPCS